jgi:hypothetical protein
VLVFARDRIYDDFIRCCRPSAASTILDFGVSDVVNDGANLVERKYPHPERITAVGLGAAPAFQAAFPAVTYLQTTPGSPLPFADRQFDIAASNAVLEHVGSEAAQRALVAELSRVARTVFITVPNRYFPVEHHTAIPLLHFWGPTFAAACRALGKSSWTREENLILMSRRKLLALAQGGTGVEVGHTGIRLGPFSSNLYLLIDGRRLGA